MRVNGNKEYNNASYYEEYQNTNRSYDCDDCCNYCNYCDYDDCCDCCDCCQPVETEIKSTGHIGTRDIEVFVPGITGGIPFNQIFSKTGRNISGADPIELIGPHTYLIEWSTSLDPIDSDATAFVRLLLDDRPMKGSGHFTDITARIEGFAALSGGAVINVPSGIHELRLEAITGKKGALAIDSNVRIVQII